MNATTFIAAHADAAGNADENDISSALRFITCGSVDDGKSTLIGRLLIDSRSVLQDQLANVSRGGTADLAQFTDGLIAEREQGITIDVAYRYFNTARRKFIIGDTPGHEQYTRNMVTAASSADCAVVLVDATKLAWQDANLSLLEQTRRHTLLLQLLRVPSIVFAVNKLDALEHDAPQAFAHIRSALARFAREADISIQTVVPISALLGHNVVAPAAPWCGYHGPSLLQVLETLPSTSAATGQSLAMPVQWVEKFAASNTTAHGRRIFWGRLASGSVRPGDAVHIWPGKRRAVVAQVLNATRQAGAVYAGHSAGIVLDHEVDVSRGDWLLAESPARPWQPTRALSATVAWLDDEPLQAARVYWALHGHRWVRARVQRIVHQLNIHTLAAEPAQQLTANAIGEVELALQDEIVTRPYTQCRQLGAMILVDTASHRTAGAVLIH